MLERLKIKAWKKEIQKKKKRDMEILYEIFIVEDKNQNIIVLIKEEE